MSTFTNLNLNILRYCHKHKYLCNAGKIWSYNCVHKNTEMNLHGIYMTANAKLSFLQSSLHNKKLCCDAYDGIVMFEKKDTKLFILCEKKIM